MTKKKKYDEWMVAKHNHIIRNFKKGAFTFLVLIILTCVRWFDDADVETRVLINNETVECAQFFFFIKPNSCICM